MKSLFSLMSLLIIILTPAILFAEAEPQQVWEPQVSGRFYPGNETVLKDQINTFLKKIPKQTLKGMPVAIISPHAGYQYSGQVAAYGYSAIKDAGFNRVIILAPSHFMSGKRFRGVSILKVKNFKTPLGVIPVDEDACNQLLNTSKESKPDASHQAIKLFGSYEGAYKGEHSLETQLPFLQTALNTFKVVPIIIGVLIDNDYDQVADTIRPLMDDKTLLVVSSDFTHYGEGYGYVPFRNDIEKNIRALDYGAFDKILSKDFDGLRIYRKETGINACGIIPIALLLKLLPSEAQGEILNYDTSGRQSGDFSFSVSYTSIIFTKPSETKSGHYIPKTETIENTINSSANDWRFSPVEAKEISDITIEISVLSQMKKINGPDEFIVGKEGIIIRKGPASAVFLPQVATEQGWDRVETLCHLCRKAGLSPDG